MQDDWRISSRLTLNLGLRYELMTPPIDTTNRISTLDLSNGNIIIPCDDGQPSEKANLAAYPAFTFVCNDTVDLGNGLTKTDRNNWAPRIGFAYSTEGQKLVIRGGYGIFYSYPPMAVRIGTPSFSIPFFNQTTATNSLTSPAPTATILTTPAVSAFAGQPYSTDYDAGRTQEWSIGVQQQLGSTRVVEAVYLGSHGDSLYSQRLPNQAPPGPGTVNSRKPYPLLAANMIWSGPIGWSNYNAMQLRFEQRLSRGLAFVAHYTLASAKDTASNLLSNAANPSIPQNSRNLDGEYSRSSFDARHRFVVNGVYRLPFSASGGARLAGRRVGHLVGAHAAEQHAVLAHRSRPTGAAAAASPTVPIRLAIRTTSTIARRSSSSTLPPLPCRQRIHSAAPDATSSTARRSSCSTWRCRKRSISPRRPDCSLRVDIFNALNFVNFNIPNRNFGTPQFGTMTSARDARTMQFGAKFIF